MAAEFAAGGASGASKAPCAGSQPMCPAQCVEVQKALSAAGYPAIFEVKWSFREAKGQTDAAQSAGSLGLDGSGDTPGLQAVTLPDMFSSSGSFSVDPPSACGRVSLECKDKSEASSILGKLLALFGDSEPRVAEASKIDERVEMLSANGSPKPHSMIDGLPSATSLPPRYDSSTWSSGLHDIDVGRWSSDLSHSGHALLAQGKGSSAFPSTALPASRTIASAPPLPLESERLDWRPRPRPYSGPPPRSASPMRPPTMRSPTNSSRTHSPSSRHLSRQPSPTPRPSSRPLQPCSDEREFSPAHRTPSHYSSPRWPSTTGRSEQDFGGHLATAFRQSGEASRDLPRVSAPSTLLSPASSVPGFDRLASGLEYVSAARQRCGLPPELASPSAFGGNAESTSLASTSASASAFDALHGGMQCRGATGSANTAGSSDSRSDFVAQFNQSPTMAKIRAFHMSVLGSTDTRPRENGLASPAVVSAASNAIHHQGVRAASTSWQEAVGAAVSLGGASVTATLAAARRSASPGVSVGRASRPDTQLFNRDPLADLLRR
eukprot:TRINITY_DN37392_c0_g1_i1.p1 TRINITY_DN37392_c0_g1~~TRINITY_DN37392_c0_g1_i1.p1  ORF type:complete len:562 (-),score=59.39 TRINITY_DN37392_c0_g1_i1:164-1813(-)